MKTKIENDIGKGKKFVRDKYMEYKDFLKFGLVGGLGTIVNTAILYFLTMAGLHYIVASIIATETAIIFNFLGNHIFTFKKEQNGLSFLSKFLSFQAISVTTIIGTVTILWILVNLFGEQLLLLWNLVAILVMFLANFSLNRDYTWGEKQYSALAKYFSFTKTKAFRIFVVVLMIMIVLLMLPAIAEADPDENKKEKKDLGNKSEDDDDSSDIIDLDTNSTNSSTNLTQNDTSDSTNLTGNGTETNSTGDSTNSTGNETGSGGNETGSDDSTNSTGNETGSGGNETESDGSTGSGTESGPKSEVVFDDASKTWQIFETNTILIRKQFSNSTQVNWSVNGELVLSTEGKIHEFRWSPGPLFTSNSDSLEIEATGESWSQTWNADVSYVINPFFSSPDGSAATLGSDEATINLFTNLDAYQFSSTKAVLTNDGDDTEHALRISFNNSDEVQWKKTVNNLPGGNNYITKIEGTLDSGEVITFDLGNKRAHFVEGGSAGGGGAGGAGGFQQEDDDDSNPNINRPQGTPEMVYLVFGKDVISKGETQTIQLDAVNFEGGVQYVAVEILTPSGDVIERELTLATGSASYGTWEGSFQVSESGEYSVNQVILSPPEVLVEADASFYATADASGEDRRLYLVYSTLSQGQVDAGEEVTLTLDAVDETGIEEITAKIMTSNGESFTTPLRLVRGSENYGTWEATIKAGNPDTTYTVSQVTLKNGEENKTYDVTDRSFYVNYEPRNSSLGINGGGSQEQYSTFSEAWFRNITDIPLFPTILAFSLMILAAFIWVAGYKMTSLKT